MAVSLRLLYLIFGWLLRWLALLGRTTSSKAIELLQAAVPTIGRQRAAQST